LQGYGGGIPTRLHTERIWGFPHYIAPAQTAQKTSLQYCVFSRCRENNVFTELFPSNSCYTVACLHSCHLAMGLHVTICN
jgi:hypothetical protein